MTAKHPTFLVKNGEGSSYLFRTIIPKDIRQYLNNSKEIRISLLTGLKSEAKRLAQLLKYQVDKMFLDVRSGSNSTTSATRIKSTLKEYLYQVKVSENHCWRDDGDHHLSPLPFDHAFIPKTKIPIPMEQKLVADYVNRFSFGEIREFCLDNDIEYKADDYPKDRIRKARQILVKKIGEDIGYHEFASELARDILTEYLSTLDLEGFKKLFKTNRIDNDRVVDALENPDGINVENVIELLEEELDIIPIARRVGVRYLFKAKMDVHENDQSKPEPIEKLWNGLKSNGDQSTDDQVPSEEQSSREIPGNVKKISVVFGEYISEMKASGSWNPKSELESRSSLLGLVEIIGDLPISKLSYEVGRTYKNTLMKLPANRKKIERYRDLAVEQILKLDDVPPMSARTVNNNIAKVIAFMHWARRQGFIKENYFEGLKLTSTKKAQDERKAFSDADLNKIFNPVTFKEAANGIDHRYWVPLLGAFTGARINEICQLHVGDIKKKDDLWCMDINAKSEDANNSKRLKNKSSERLIPLHDKLIELGFIDFVKKQRKAKVVRLFPDLYYNINDGHSRKVGRWFNEKYLRKKLGITDPAKSFHSFRHTVADRLKQLGVAESFIAELLGHSSGDTMSFGRYGKRYQPKVLMKEAVKKIDYQFIIQNLTKKTQSK